MQRTKQRAATTAASDGRKEEEEEKEGEDTERLRVEERSFSPLQIYIAPPPTPTRVRRLLRGHCPRDVNTRSTDVAATAAALGRTESLWTATGCPPRPLTLRSLRSGPLALVVRINPDFYSL